MSGDTACTQANTSRLLWINSKVLAANVQTVVAESANNKMSKMHSKIGSKQKKAINMYVRSCFYMCVCVCGAYANHFACTWRMLSHFGCIGCHWKRLLIAFSYIFISYIHIYCVNAIERDREREKMRQWERQRNNVRIR